MSSDSHIPNAEFPEGVVLPPLPPGADRIAPGAPPIVAPPPPAVVAHRVEVLQPKTASAKPARKPHPIQLWLRPWLSKERRPWVSFGASAVVHALLLVVLGLVVAMVSAPRGPSGILQLTIEEGHNTLEQNVTKFQTSDQPLDSQAQTALEQHIAVHVPSPQRAINAPVMPTGQTPAGVQSVQANDLLKQVDRGLSRLLDGRTGPERATLVKEGGGTDDSEAAVERGLRWLAAHQLPSGAWHFNHQLGPCNGYCRHPGTAATTTGATALALLPFLGAGHTHQQGEYREVVARGLNYLCQRMVQTPHGGDLMEGTMYAQGLSAIVLCEAFAMTNDTDLLPYARAAINFIVYAQDRNGGGWRYQPGTPGDTTVSGWQIMALKSAQIAYIAVPPETLERASMFLDSVSQSDGAFYGYQAPAKEPCNTAIGLLCRMYSGWNREHRPLALGVKYLGGLGPSPTDMYFNYYATQVLHHYGGPEWIAWNNKMRDYLVRTQANQGHESGSWYFKDKHGDVGGRLFNTAMAVLTLEVYYRYLPIYESRAIQGW